MDIQFANNAVSQLAQPADIGDMMLVVSEPELFPPSASTDNPFYVTLDDESKLEICKVVGVNGNQFTVERGQDGTIEDLFGAGSIVSMRITRAMLENFAQLQYVDDKNAEQDALIALKADTTYVDSELALKADTTYVDSQLALKADITYVDSENAAQNAVIAQKADTTYVDSELALKADTTYVDSANAAQDAVIAQKADTTYVDSENATQDAVIAQKADASYVEGVLTSFAYDIAGGAYGSISPGVIIMAHVAARAFSLPAGLVGSYGTVFTNPSADTTFSIRHGASSVGIMTVSTTGDVSFSMTNAQTFQPGEVLSIVALADTNGLEDLFFTLAGTYDAS